MFCFCGRPLLIFLTNEKGSFWFNYWIIVLHGPVNFCTIQKVVGIFQRLSFCFVFFQSRHVSWFYILFEFKKWTQNNRDTEYGYVILSENFSFYTENTKWNISTLLLFPFLSNYFYIKLIKLLQRIPNRKIVIITYELHYYPNVLWN